MGAPVKKKSASVTSTITTVRAKIALIVPKIVFVLIMQNL
tara:strand:+ start:137 stop:256 length:120 start_codon:yes stop_codon:yes gene_type:complete